MPPGGLGPLREAILLVFKAGRTSCAHALHDPAQQAVLRLACADVEATLQHAAAGAASSRGMWGLLSLPPLLSSTAGLALELCMPVAKEGRLELRTQHALAQLMAATLKVSERPLRALILHAHCAALLRELQVHANPS